MILIFRINYFQIINKEEKLQISMACCQLTNTHEEANLWLEWDEIVLNDFQIGNWPIFVLKIKIIYEHILIQFNKLFTKKKKQDNRLNFCEISEQSTQRYRTKENQLKTCFYKILPHILPQQSGINISLWYCNKFLPGIHPEHKHNSKAISGNTYITSNFILH
jgi:hypothetical protein